jgi:3-mercaptopyruvate sulfurtransferase SseA
LARELQRRGFRRVRPLAGGFAAWKASGRRINLPSLATELSVAV